MQPARVELLFRDQEGSNDVFVGSQASIQI